MIDLKGILKQKGTQILLFAGMLKLGVLLFITREAVSFDFDLIISALVFLIYLGFFARFIPKRMTLKNLFITGFLAMLIYNFGVGALGLAAQMQAWPLILSALDMGIATVIIGYIMGVRR